MPANNLHLPLNLQNHCHLLRRPTRSHSWLQWSGSDLLHHNPSCRLTPPTYWCRSPLNLYKQCSLHCTRRPTQSNLLPLPQRPLRSRLNLHLMPPGLIHQSRRHFHQTGHTLMQWYAFRLSLRLHQPPASSLLLFQSRRPASLPN